MSNLLPKEEQHTIIRLYRLRYVVVGIIFLAGICFASALLLFPSFFLLKNTQTILEAKKVVLTNRGAGLVEQELAQSVKEVNGHLAVFDEKAPSSPLVKSIIDPLLTARFEGIKITSISYAVDQTVSSRANVEIAGTATTRETLLRFTDKIRTSGSFSSVSVPITNFIHDENATFIISVVADLK